MRAIIITCSAAALFLSACGGASEEPVVAEGEQGPTTTTGSEDPGQRPVGMGQGGAEPYPGTAGATTDE